MKKKIGTCGSWLKKKEEAGNEEYPRLKKKRIEKERNGLKVMQVCENLLTNKCFGLSKGLLYENKNFK